MLRLASSPVCHCILSLLRARGVFADTGGTGVSSQTSNRFAAFHNAFYRIVRRCRKVESIDLRRLSSSDNGALPRSSNTLASHYDHRIYSSWQGRPHSPYQRSNTRRNCFVLSSFVLPNTSSGCPCSTMTPRSMNMTRLLTALANGISCVTTTIVIFSSAS